jgi:hypothetical protein
MTQPLRSIRIWLGIFIAGLILSGITAFSLESELSVVISILKSHSVDSGLLPWLQRVHEALATTNAHYPFLAYGTDWLAFAHLVIAIVFIGPFLDPVRNKWVVQFGLVACVAVIPLALIAGPIRGIPFYWRLIDCSFGVFGTIPLLIVLRNVRELERQNAKSRIPSTSGTTV